MAKKKASGGEAKLNKKKVIAIAVSVVVILAVVITLIVVMTKNKPGPGTVEDELDVSTSVIAPNTVINPGDAIPEKTNWDDGSYEESAATVYSENLKKYSYSDLNVPGITMTSYGGAFYPPPAKKKYRHTPNTKYEQKLGAPTYGQRDMKAEEFIYDLLQKGFTIRTRNYPVPACSFAALGRSPYSQNVYNSLLQACKEYADPAGTQYEALMEKDVTYIPLRIGMYNETIFDDKTKSYKIAIDDSSGEIYRNMIVYTGLGTRYFDKATMQGAIVWDVQISVVRNGSSYKVKMLSYNRRNSDPAEYGSQADWEKMNYGRA